VLRADLRVPGDEKTKRGRRNSSSYATSQLVNPSGPVCPKQKETAAGEREKGRSGGASRSLPTGKKFIPDP